MNMNMSIYEFIAIIYFVQKLKMSDITKTLSLYQGQPLIKNSHLITHILVYKNEQILLFGDKTILIYSLSKMLSSQASLVHIIDLTKTSQPSQQAQHMDKITKTFNQTNQQQKFGQKIFQNQNDLNTNIMLNVQSFANRLKYLSGLRIKQVQIQDHGDLLLHFCNNRVVLIKRDQKNTYYKSIKSINVNDIIKTKVQFSGFVSGTNNLVFFVSSDKIHFYNYIKMKQQFLIKFGDVKANNIKSFILEKISSSKQHLKKHILMVQFAQKIDFYQISGNKKLLHVGHYINRSTFIQTPFLFLQSLILYIPTCLSLTKLCLSQLFIQQPLPKLNRSRSKQPIKSLIILNPILMAQFSSQDPQQIIYVDMEGNYILRQKSQTMEYFRNVGSLMSGAFVGITSRKQGNYKDGQLIIALRKMELYRVLNNCLQHVVHLKSYQYANFNDLFIFNVFPKFKKQLVSLFSKLFTDTFAKMSNQLEMPEKNQIDEQNGLQDLQKQRNQKQFQVFQQIKITRKQFSALVINIGSIFQAKQHSQIKQIQKRLLNHLKQHTDISLSTQKLKKLKDLCIFTHKQIGSQQMILECKICNLYGIKPVSELSLDEQVRYGLHKCYVCLNHMTIV